MKTTKKLKAGFITLGLSFVLFTNLNAQDILTLKNGDELEVKVLEITETEIKYRKYDSPDGPYRFINKSVAFSVKYENGSKDVFGDEPVKTINNNTGPIYQNNSGPVKQIIVQQPEPVNSEFDKDSSDFANTRRKRYSGPRIGATYFGPGTNADALAYAGYENPYTTQFGWQFESRLFTTPEGIQGLIEYVPLISGIEKGKFIPSFSLLFGVRGGGKNPFEFAMGPTFYISRDYRTNAVAAVGVVIAAGTSFKSGNIVFPITFAFVPEVKSKATSDWSLDPSATSAPMIKKGQTVSTGFKISLLIGLNYRKK